MISLRTYATIFAWSFTKFQVLNIFSFVPNWIKATNCQFKYENHYETVKYSTKMEGPL